MINVKIDEGEVELTIKGYGIDLLTEVLSILSNIYSAYESTEKGSGDEFLDVICRVIQQGKIQEWSGEAAK